MDTVKNFLATQGTYLEDEYPYTGVAGSCLSSSLTAVNTNDVAVEGLRLATNHDSNSKADFMAALRDQPLIIPFEVTESFYQYSSGIFTGDDCGDVLNHMMQAVGYGTTASGVQYAIVRNQWGDWWGEDGYVNVELDNSIDGLCQLYWPSFLTKVGAPDIANLGYQY